MSLCTTCQSIDLQYIIDCYTYSKFHPEGRKKASIGFQHHKTYSDLKASAESCRCCALFYEESNADPKYPQKPPININDTVKIYARTGRDAWPERYVVRGQEVALLSLSVAVESPNDNSISYSKNVAIWVDEDAPAELKQIILTRPVCVVEDFSIPQKWLQNCFKTHPECRMTREPRSQAMLKEFSPLPSRVVLVGKADGTEAPILLETNGQKGMYLALSHCWGPEPVCRTTQSTLSDHKAGMKLADLSANFRDAILITRRLGMKYLWIDSLCIVQDSIEDWETESSKMADVYQNAILVLSAANSRGAAQGFLNPRPDYRETSVAIPNLNGSGVFYLGYMRSVYADDVDGGPLNSRGWTLQERILARRNLFFGKDQCHWECKSAQYSQETPESLQAPSDIAAGVSYLVHLYSKVHTAAGRQAVFNLWYNLLGEFTRRSLTVGDDRLSACSGIANAFNTTMATQNLYFAGIWQEDLARGLLWQNFGPTAEAQKKNRRPSWSWSSVDGPIFSARELKSQVVDIRCVEITAVKGRDPFGRVESARLVVQGRIRAVPTAVRTGLDFQDARRGFYVLTNVILKNEKGEKIGAGDVDDPQMELNDGAIYCLPVRHPGRVDLGQMKVESLLLVHATNAKEDEYVRVGTATLSVMGGDVDHLIAPFQIFLAGAEEQRVVIV